MRLTITWKMWSRPQSETGKRPNPARPAAPVLLPVPPDRRKKLPPTPAPHPINPTSLTTCRGHPTMLRPAKNENGAPDPVFRPQPHDNPLANTDITPVADVPARPAAPAPDNEPAAPVTPTASAAPGALAATGDKPAAVEPPRNAAVVNPLPQPKPLVSNEDPARETSTETPVPTTQTQTESTVTPGAPVLPAPAIAEGGDPVASDQTAADRPAAPSIEVTAETGSETEETIPASGSPAPAIDPGAVIDDIAGTPITPPAPNAGATVTVEAAPPAQQAQPANPAQSDPAVPATPVGQNGQPAVPDSQPPSVQDRATAAAAPKPQAPQNGQPQQAASTQPAAPAPDSVPAGQQTAQPAPASPQPQTASATETANAAGVRPEPAASTAPVTPASPAAPAGAEKAAAPVPPASTAPKPSAGLLDTTVSPKPEGGAPQTGAATSNPEQGGSKPALTTALDVTGNGQGSQAPAKPGPAPITPISTAPLDPALPQGLTPASEPASSTLPLAQNSHTVSVRFGASPLPGSAPQMPVNTLAFNIARNVENGVNRFEIRIDPPELGRVDVKLDMTVEGRVQAHLTVERSETLELMMRDARSLEKALADTGLNMNRDSLSFSLKDQNASGGGQNADGTAPNQNDAVETAGEDEQPGNTARGYITDTGVDISV